MKRKELAMEERPKKQTRMYACHDVREKAISGSEITRLPIPINSNVDKFTRETKYTDPI